RQTQLQALLEPFLRRALEKQGRDAFVEEVGVLQTASAYLQARVVPQVCQVEELAKGGPLRRGEHRNAKPAFTTSINSQGEGRGVTVQALAHLGRACGNGFGRLQFRQGDARFE